MKKAIFLLAIVFIPAFLLAQDSLGIEIPEDVWEVLSDPNKWLGTLIAIAGVSVLLTQTVVRLWGEGWKKWVKQLLSWIFGIVLALLANLINIGFLAEETWLMTVLTGLAIGLVSNGIFDASFVKAILEFIRLKLPKKE